MACKRKTRAKPPYMPNMELINGEPPTEEEIQTQYEIDYLFAYKLGQHLPFLTGEERRLEANDGALRRNRTRRGAGHGEYVSNDLPTDMRPADLVGKTFRKYDPKLILQEK